MNTPENILYGYLNTSSFKESKFAMLFNEQTQVNPILTVLKEKGLTYAKILKNSEIQRAQSVKLLAKRNHDKKKLEEDMKNVTRVISKTRITQVKIKNPEPEFNFKFSSIPKVERTQIVCNWDKLSTQGWIPEAREGASMVGYNNTLYLIGGLSSSILNQVLTLSLLDFKWVKQEQFSHKLEPIFGHSCVFYDSQFLIVGGMSDYNDLTRKRECLNIIRSLNPATIQMGYMATHGVIYEYRKYHSCVVYGKHLLLYGGLNPKNNILDSCITLNLIRHRWRNVDTTGDRPMHLAGHSACAVYSPGTYASLFRVSNPSSSIFLQGIYCFGGYDFNYKANNTLYVLRPGKRPLVWVKPSTTGNPPSPRYYHTMLWNEHINSLVIYGGRNDETGVSYADVHILRLENLMWIRAIITGNPPAPRSSHSASMLSKKMYVFGGVSNGKFCQSETMVMSFEFPDRFRRDRLNSIAIR